MDHPHGPHDPTMTDNGSYGFYGSADAEHGPGFGMYQDPMNGYAGMGNPGMPPRSMSSDVMPQFSTFDRGAVPMGLMPPHQIQTGYLYQPQQQQHVGLGMAGSPPASPSIYEALSPPISGSDTSGNEAHYHSRTHSGATSPSSSRRNSFVARGSLRYNPTPSPSSGSERRRTRGASISEEDDDGMGHGDHIASQRKEATRKQRIEAEQKRRDELRDGYAKLKDVLPVSNAKSSKVSLLDRATKHIVDLERRNEETNARLNTLEQEVRRLRALNEKISLSMGISPAAAPSPGTSVMSGTRTPSGASPMLGAQPLSPPPDPDSHSLTAVARQDAPGEHSDGSDGF